MINWLRRKIYQFVMYDEGASKIEATSPSYRYNRRINDVQGLSFNIYFAVSGYVIEVNRLSDERGPTKQQSDPKKLYIISEDDDLAKSITEILLLEKLRG